ncbi:MAG: hypothetical protein LUF82_03250 [Clostridia bacterium]|nr:hypothetical protein [Clostridia bacterium]
MQVLAVPEAADVLTAAETSSQRTDEGIILLSLLLENKTLLFLKTYVPPNLLVASSGGIATR